MSCCKCFFISASDFPGRVITSENVPDSYLTPSIELAQIVFIKPLLCDDLYNEICEEVELGYISAANEALLCYIRDVQVRYAFADFLMKHTTKVTKESVVRKVADESEFVPYDQIEKVAKQYRLDADNYSDIMIQFLKDNSDTYPLWSNSRCGGCNIDENQNSGFF